MFKPHVAITIKSPVVLPQRGCLNKFVRDEEGSLIILTLLLLVVMLVLGGMAVDFMRFESRRAMLQSVSDRAVLAAANLDQSLEAEQVVEDYFEKSGFGGSIVGKPFVSDSGGSRFVSVNADLDIDTFYLRMIGIDTLTASAASSAVEGVGDVEVSLVLDISYSMRQMVSGLDKTRIQLLREAATAFVDELLLPEYENQISMSLVSYSQQVNVGQGIFDALRTTPDSITEDGLLIDSSDPDFDDPALGEIVTNTSLCVDLEPEDYETTTFDTDRTYDQVERFQALLSTGPTIDRPVCPQEDFQAIIPLTQDRERLKRAINQFVPAGYTSIDLGMKWGVTLLDPSVRTLMSTVPDVAPIFAGNRPADYVSAGDGPDALKFVVLMTDGENWAWRRLNTEYYNDFFWRKTFGTYGFDYWRNNVNDHPDGNRPSLQAVSDIRQTDAQKDGLLQNICNAAKDQGITVFTIAMGAEENGEDQMRQCASSANHYFETEGDTIVPIFKSIARQIRALRLTQ